MRENEEEGEEIVVRAAAEVGKNGGGVQETPRHCGWPQNQDDSTAALGLKL